MIVTHYPQGSPDWYQARLGVITASRFADALALSQECWKVLRSTGTVAKSCTSEEEAEAFTAKNDTYTIEHVPPVPLQAREDYQMELAGERLTGMADSDAQVETFWMRRGLEMEPDARGWYELATGATVEEAGLIYLDDRKTIGASVDGLIGDDGQAEIKCFKRTNHDRIVLAGEVPEELLPQIQGQLFVTGRKWCDFISYHPEAYIPGFIKRVHADEVYHARLAKHLELFNVEVESLVKQFKHIKEAA